MGPNSLPPMDLQNKSLKLWLIAFAVFFMGLGAGVVLPKAVQFFGSSASKVASSKDSLTMPGPNGKLRRVDPPLSHQAAPEASEVKLESKVASSSKAEISNEKLKKDQLTEKPKQKLSAASIRAPKEEKKLEKTVVKLDKPAAPAKEAKSSRTHAKDLKVAKVEKAPFPPSAAGLIEEVPSALTAVQIEKLMQNNSNVLARSQKAQARPVSLPPSQALNAPNSMPQSLSALPLLKTDPRADSKPYPVNINNASFSKANLASCTKRCALLGMDAMGHPIRAIIDGPSYASTLMQHNGTINISGQPRIIKNQQVLLVENITFNLAPSQKAPAKRSRTAAVPPAAVDDKASAGYTEVSFEDDDLKPGTVIKNRKQIPIEDEQDIPAP